MDKYPLIRAGLGGIAYRKQGIDSLRKITVNRLLPAERELLEFNMDTLGYTQEEREITYKNLYRDTECVAVYKNRKGNRLIRLIID